VFRGFVMSGRLAGVIACGVLLLTPPLGAIKPDVLQSVGAIPAHIAGRFRDPVGFQQSAFGQFYVFDRRLHAVYGVDEQRESSWEIIQIGAEPGRIIDPTAFSVEPNGTFAVADAPNGRERIQIFSAVGFRIGGFQLPGRVRPRVVFESFVLNGVGSLQYIGTSILMSQPETGALITEYGLNGTPTRSIGQLRHTGHEDDRELHFALNSGLPLVDPAGGFFFVFQTGEPVYRKYDRDGQLVLERHIVGKEIDEAVGKLPTTWPKRATSEGEMPLVRPTVRAAAVDRRGRLWVSFVIPFTYVYDADGDKIRALQFRAAGVMAPNSLFFGKNDRAYVTPGLFEFDSRAGWTGQAGRPLPPVQPLLPGSRGAP
jgi:hypothetical protein